MSKTMTDPQSAYTTRPPVQDDWGWETKQDEPDLEAQEDAAKFSDFQPVCRHRFDFFPARQIWLIFRCVHCGLRFTPEKICEMLNKGGLFQAGIDQRIGEVFG